MKYLFFDIECAGVFKNIAKICAFGYCLTDEKFNILEKEDLLVNPKGGFHLTDRKGSRGIVLPYEYGEFKKFPTFPQVSEKIYALLHDPDTIVAGHATMNDVKYLNLETLRFSLPSFSFRFADTQFIYMNRIGDYSRQLALGTIAQELGVEFTPHRAVDDAYATMKVAEAMCKEENVDFLGLLEKYQITLGKIENHEITQNTSVGFEKHVAEVAKRKEERERKRIHFHNFVDKAKRRRAKDGKLKGKNVCFSHPLEQDTELAEDLVVKVFAAGGFFTCRAEEADVYVYFEEETGARLENLKKGKARLFTVEEFTEFLVK